MAKHHPQYRNIYTRKLQPRCPKHAPRSGEARLVFSAPYGPCFACAAEKAAKAASKAAEAEAEQAAAEQHAAEQAAAEQAAAEQAAAEQAATERQ